MTYYARVTDGAEYVDRTLATASWWDRHVLKGGDYLFVPSHIQGSWVARIDSTLVEEYRENRILQFANAVNRETDVSTKVSLHMYGFDLKKRTAAWDGAVEIIWKDDE